MTLDKVHNISLSNVTRLPAHKGVAERLLAMLLRKGVLRNFSELGEYTVWFDATVGAGKKGELLVTSPAGKIVHSGYWKVVHAKEYVVTTKRRVVAFTKHEAVATVLAQLERSGLPAEAAPIRRKGYLG